MTQGAALLLEAREITKTFGAFTANDRVSLRIAPGEKHALLGENGAGKSTLVKMIYGVMQPTSGSFHWGGMQTKIDSPAAARMMGVGMVFQHFSIFDALTVAENIALALKPEAPKALAARIASLSETYGLAIDPAREAHTLSVGEKQRVEIIRCLLQNPQLIILDEPTSVLTPQEADALFVTLNRLSSEGRAVLYISHKLDEVRALCDAATILRRGKVVGHCDPKVESSASLAEKMVGEEVAWVKRDAARKSGGGEARLALRGLTLPPAEPGGRTLRELEMTARGGEILGIAGVAGEGQDALMAAITGERLAPQPGMVEIDGAAVGRMGPNARRKAGAAFAPEERNGHAAIAEMTLSDNAMLSLHAPENMAPGGVLRIGAAKDWAKRVIKAFDVRGPSEDPTAGSLSGGNLQKFVVGREILRKPGVFVVSQPTWGVDAGAASTIHRALVDLAAGGAAVVMISQDLEEIFAIADRIAVIHDGKLSAAYPVEDMTAERVGLLMGGAHPETSHEESAA